MVRREEQPWQARAHPAARLPLLRARRRGPRVVVRVGGRGGRVGRRPPGAHGYHVRLLTDTGATWPARRTTRAGSAATSRAPCSTRSPSSQLVRNASLRDAARGAAPRRRRRPARRGARLARPGGDPAAGPAPARLHGRGRDRCWTPRPGRSPARSRRPAGRPRGLGRAAARLRLAGAAGKGRRLARRPVGRRRPRTPWPPGPAPSRRRGVTDDDSPARCGCRSPPRSPPSPPRSAWAPSFLTGGWFLPTAFAVLVVGARLRGGAPDVGVAQRRCPLGGAASHCCCTCCCATATTEALFGVVPWTASVDRLGELAATAATTSTATAPRSASPPASSSSPWAASA